MPSNFFSHVGCDANVGETTDQSAVKAKGSAKASKKFADLLWPDCVLIEMKRRGENLEKHYDQLFDQPDADRARASALAPSTGSDIQASNTVNHVKARWRSSGAE